MQKSLSERIAARAIKNKSPQSHSDENENRALFLALRPEIKQALDDGWPIRTIWETLHEEGKVTCGYDSFRRYTRHLILTPPSQNPKQPEQPAPTRTARPKADETPQIRGFTFNPSPKKEDLF